METKTENMETKTENMENDTDNLYLVKFSKPYEFEGKTYTEIDLNPCADLTGNDAAKAEKILAARGENSMFPEASSAYAFVLASLGTKKPVEFFNGLPLKEASKVKNRVRTFFL